ncbi:MAG: glycosyltransferase [Victivallales bacterium]|jgi:glycosyltransferase involved in cell wall biosynthesis|nr:glycosyltransferase [Victivallales bacterium]
MKNSENHNADIAISIVVAIYNMESRLSDCLNSLLNQTLPNIEIICVDDGSSDNSPVILREFAHCSEKLKIITFPENRGVSQTRKAGVEYSRGKYVIFVDADDELEIDACENMYGAMIADPVEILHVGTTVVNSGNCSKEEIAACEQCVRPYNGKLYGEEILKSALIKREFPYTLWGKLFDSTLCRRAFREIEDGFFCMAEDLYVFSILAFYAKSYRGIPDLFAYRYSYGVGISTCKTLTLERFTAVR